MTYNMKNIVLCAVAIFLFQGVTSVVYEDIGNANEHCDNALNQILQEPSIIKEIEPVAVPDIVRDKLKTSNGKLWGLSSGKRDGDCTYGISHSDDKGNPHDTLFVKGDLAVSDIRFSMDYEVKVLFVKVAGTMEGKIDSVGASGRFYLNENENAVLESLKVTRFDGFKITRVSAFSLQSSFVLKTISNMVAKNHKDNIVQSLENGVTSYFRTLLKEAQIQ